jgi:hypothetical protein
MVEIVEKINAHFLPWAASQGIFLPDGRVKPLARVFRYANKKNEETGKWDLPDNSSYMITMSASPDYSPRVLDSTGKLIRLTSEPPMGSEGILYGSAKFRRDVNSETGEPYGSVVCYLKGVMITQLTEYQPPEPEPYEGGWQASDDELAQEKAAPEQSPAEGLAGAFQGEEIPW